MRLSLKKSALRPDLLKRLADPGCRFYPDYLKYKEHRINRRELIARLPHVALIGDSLSRDVYISSILSTFWRARRQRGASWFSNPSRHRVYSVVERLEKLTPIVAVEHAGVGAMIDGEGDREVFSRRILRTRNLSGQINQLLARKRFPDLILIWIGHNNADWAWPGFAVDRKDPERHLHSLAKSFREQYAHQMQRLINRAKIEHHAVAIVTYGLVNFEAFFKARAVAEALRAENPELYPHLETSYKYFTSLQPAHRVNVIRLGSLINQELSAMVSELGLDLESISHVQVRYSDALATADLSRVEVIHAMDGWHPSIEGHKIFAEAAFRGLEPSLEFIGISRTPAAKPFD
jgi:lysophospholipase L1-like esterase